MTEVLRGLELDFGVGEIRPLLLLLSEGTVVELKKEIQVSSSDPSFDDLRDFIPPIPLLLLTADPEYDNLFLALASLTLLSDNCLSASCSISIIKASISKLHNSVEENDATRGIEFPSCLGDLL